MAIILNMHVGLDDKKIDIINRLIVRNQKAIENIR